MWVLLANKLAELKMTQNHLSGRCLYYCLSSSIKGEEELREEGLMTAAPSWGGE